ncbi:MULTISPECIES: phosphatase RapE inhibitor PhrE [Bacillus]|nr:MULTISPECIES: phosphatase RapE inhibitor PhrE [Bacillus]MED1143844.1 phosphatase RapE inhibitor PhrE [Bacillus paralicheniformis]NRF06137.1 phosphatase RapE inhibitor PhrE [Bacillus safensis]
MKSKLFISLSAVLIGLAFFGSMSNGKMKEASRNVTLAPTHEFLFR